MDDTDLDVAPEPCVWFLSAEELAATRAKLATILTRAARKGFTGSVELHATPTTRPQDVPGGIAVTVHGFDVTITGEPPRYAGWRFVAAVDAVDGGTILRFPPGQDATVSNADVVAGQCDHCHTRRARRSTVVVRHDDTGELLQVGRSCLKDFLGHAITPVFLAIDDIRTHLDKAPSDGPPAWDIDSVLAYAWAAVQGFGWTPSSAADSRRISTRDVVRTVLAGQRGFDQLLTVIAPHLEEGRRQAPVIREALLAGLTGASGYEANLTTILRGRSVDDRHLGLAVSAITAHQRLIEHRQTEAARQQAAATIEFAGEVGDKVTLTGVVRAAMRVDGFTRHSPDNVLLVLDCGTAVAKMTTAASWARRIAVGDQLTVVGTVKAHTRWRGVKQTVLVRPKPVDVVDGASPDGAQDALWERVASPRLDGAATARKALAPSRPVSRAPSR